jgi:hypothetical protein
MENERPIEKLLRRFAKKRQDAAGAPLELHPATRRLLQGEVTRHYAGGRRGAPSGPGRLGGLWFKLAWGSVAAILVVLAGVLVLPEMNRSRSAVKSANLEGVNTVTLAKAETAATVRREAVEEAVPPAVIATPTPPATTMAEKRPTGLAKDAPSDGTFADRAPASETFKSDSLRRFGFATTNAPEAAQQVARFSNTESARTRTPVLTSFAVEQVNGEIRVTDSDGSTYAGNLVLNQASAPAPAAAPGAAPAPAQTARAGRAMKANAPVASSGLAAEVASVQNLSLNAQNNFFRVAGTNRTLKQQVVFEGNFIGTNNLVQSSMQNQSNAQFQNVQFLINNSTIVGRAQVNQGREFEVNAVPITRSE